MDKQNKSRAGNLTLSIATLSKYMAVLYIIVSKAFVPLGMISGSIRLALLLLLTLITLFSENMRLKGNVLLKIEFVLIVVTSLSGFIVATNKNYVLDTVQSLLYDLLFGYCVYRISVKEKSIDWFALAWVVSGLILVGYVFITGGYSVGKLSRLSINESTNVNTVGVFIAFAIWCVLYLMSNRKISVLHLVGGTIIIALFLYFIIQTASRKSLIASLFLIIFWIVFALHPHLKRMSVGRRLAIITFFLTAVWFIYYRFGSEFARVSASMSYRMQMLLEENITDMHRFDLIIDACKVFFEHPFFGVGWNNYRYYSFSGQYAHNTYVEVLACTGILGSSFAYAMWWVQIKSILVSVKNRIGRVQIANIISLFLVLVFIDAVQIMYYNSTLLMVMNLLFTLCTISNLNANHKSIEG